MAAPVRSQYAAFAGNAGTTSYTVPGLPASTISTDALPRDDIIVFVSTDGNPTISLDSVSDAAGWDIMYQQADGTLACKGAILSYRVQTAGVVPALTINLSVSEAIVCHAIRLRPSSNKVASYILTVATGNSTNPNPPAATNNTGGIRDFYVMVAWMGDGIVVSTGAPSSFGNHFAVTVSDATNGCSGGTADIQTTIGNGGTQDPAAFSGRATEQWVAWTLAAWDDVIPADALVSTNIATSAASVSQSAITTAHGLTTQDISSSFTTEVEQHTNPEMDEPLVATAPTGWTGTGVRTGAQDPYITAGVYGFQSTLADGTGGIYQNHGGSTGQQVRVQFKARKTVTPGTANVNIYLGNTLLYTITSTSETPTTGFKIYDAIHTRDSGTTDSIRLAGNANSYVEVDYFRVTYTVTSTYVPTISAATAGQIQVTPLATLNITTSAPAISAVTLGQRHGLVNLNIATTAPAVSIVTVGQRHVFTSVNLATTAPAISVSVVGQKHTLSNINITTPAPAISLAIIGQKHTITAINITTSAAVVSLATLAQRHILAALNITTPIPIISAAIITQRHTLSTVGLPTGPPAISLATLAIAGVPFTSVNITTSTPSISLPTVGQRHVISTTNIATSAPAISLAAITQTHNLLSNLGPNILLNSEFDADVIWAKAAGIVIGGGVSTWTSVASAGLLSQLKSGQTIGLQFQHSFEIVSITQGYVQAYWGTGTGAVKNLPGIYTSKFNIGAASTNYGVRANGITSGVVDNVTINQILSEFVTAPPEISQAAITQTQTLATNNITSPTPVISQATLGVIPSELDIARPIDTITTGGWRTETGGTDLHNSIDETTPNDADYIRSPDDSLNDVARIRIGGWGAQSIHGIMKLHYRLQRVGPNPAITQTVRLYDGSTLIGGPWVHDEVTMQPFEQLIDSALVTNPNNLYIEVEAA